MNISPMHRLFMYSLFALSAVGACGDPDDEPSHYLPPMDRTAQPLYCSDSKRRLFNNSTSPYRWGDERVEINVDIAADVRCLYCADFARDMQALWQTRSDFTRRVRVYFHHYPIESIHPGTTEIHRACAAVANQGFEYFWRLHDRIFARALNRETMERDEVEQYVKQDLDLDFDRFLSDLDADATEDFVLWDRAQCRAAGVEGTPAVFVCGERLFDRSQLERVLDEKLSEAEANE